MNRGKCLRDLTKNVLMHKIPFFGKECPIKKKKKKEVDQFSVEEVKDVGAGKTF